MAACGAEASAVPSTNRWVTTLTTRGRVHPQTLAVYKRGRVYRVMALGRCNAVPAPAPHGRSKGTVAIRTLRDPRLAASVLIGVRAMLRVFTAREKPEAAIRGMHPRCTPSAHVGPLRITAHALSC